jgi:SAM-dependent methyltransferase
MNVLRWAITRAKEKGVVQTAKIAGSVLRDLSFDWNYGTDTMRWVERRALNAPSANKSHSTPYQATKSRPLLRLLVELNLPKAATFLDIGAGKGRVLLIASQYGFRKVVGIEFSRQLCAVARKNVEIFSRKTSRKWPIEVIEADAISYHFQTEDRVFFIFNPFDAFILDQFVNNIGLSLAASPRDIWLIYNTPLHHDVINKSGLFKRDSFYEIGGNHFRVYSN